MEAADFNMCHEECSETGTYLKVNQGLARLHFGHNLQQKHYQVNDTRAESPFNQ
jgi:hypothetical protein